jgi:hypothetical protein
MGIEDEKETKQKSIKEQEMKKFNGEVFEHGDFRYSNRHASTEVMGWHSTWLLGPKKKIVTLQFKGAGIVIAKIKGRAMMLFEYDLLKAFGIKGREDCFLDSSLNKFNSFTMKGEFGSVRRFYVSNHFSIMDFLRVNGGKYMQEFDSLYSGPSVPPGFHRPTACCNPSLEMTSKGFFNYAKALCESNKRIGEA